MNIPLAAPNGLPISAQQLAELAAHLEARIEVGVRETLKQYGADNQRAFDGLKAELKGHLTQLVDGAKATSARIDALEERVTAVVNKELSAPSGGKHLLGFTSWSKLVPEHRHETFQKVMTELPTQLEGKDALEAQQVLYKGSDAIVSLLATTGTPRVVYHISRRDAYLGGTALTLLGVAVGATGMHFWAKRKAKHADASTPALPASMNLPGSSALLEAMRA